MLDALTLESWEMKKAVSVSQVLMVRPYVFEGSRKELSILYTEFSDRQDDTFPLTPAPLPQVARGENPLPKVGEG